MKTISDDFETVMATLIEMGAFNGPNGNVQMDSPQITVSGNRQTIYLQRNPDFGIHVEYESNEEHRAGLEHFWDERIRKQTTDEQRWKYTKSKEVALEGLDMAIAAEAMGL